MSVSKRRRRNLSERRGYYSECSAPGCTEPALVGKWCQTHRWRLQRYGDPMYDPSDPEQNQDPPAPPVRPTTLGDGDFEGPQEGWEYLAARPGHCRVTSAYLQSTPKSILQPSHPFGFYWELHLECGAVVERRARYIPEALGSPAYRYGGGHIRPMRDVLLPPRQCRCSCGQRRGGRKA